MPGVDRWTNRVLELLLGEGRFSTQAVNAEASEHAEVFASCIEPVARGLLALSTIELYPQLALAEPDRNRFQPPFGVVKNLQTIVFHNDECGVHAKASSVFAPWGVLKLMAVVLAIGQRDDDTWGVKLDLVLPMQTHKKPGYTTFSIFEDGRTFINVYHRRNDDREQLRQNLGLPQDQTGCVVYTMYGVNNLDEYTGIPGTLQLIASSIKELGAYLTTRAEGLRELEKRLG